MKQHQIQCITFCIINVSMARLLCLVHVLYGDSVYLDEIHENIKQAARNVQWRPTHSLYSSLHIAIRIWINWTQNLMFFLLIALIHLSITLVASFQRRWYIFQCCRHCSVHYYPRPRLNGWLYPNDEHAVSWTTYSQYTCHWSVPNVVYLLLLTLYSAIPHCE